MTDWNRIAQEWSDSIKEIYPHEDFEVACLGDSIFVNLYKGHFPSTTTYFPFGVFHEDLSKRMSPEMFLFWKTVDDLRPFEQGERLWRCSIGSKDKKYVDISSLKREIRDRGLADQLKKDVEWLDENRPLPGEKPEREQKPPEEKPGEESKTSSRKLLISKRIRRMAGELLKREAAEWRH